MAGTHMDNYQTLALALPFHNCSDAQVQSEFLGIRETTLEKYKCSKFFKEMAEYTNSFTANNYKCNYYDINSFNSTFANTNNYYPKICHLNIRSLNLHKHELLAYLNSLNCIFDIILLTECGHALQASIEEVFGDHELFLKPPKSNKGGAGILVRKNKFENIEVINKEQHLTCTCNSDKCSVESTWVKLSTKSNQSLIAGSIYRHPNGNLNHFNDNYTKLLESFKGNQTCVIGGDFNIDLLQIEKYQHGEFLTTNLENNFTPCITLPTRLTTHSATLIDQIFLKLPIKRLQSKIHTGNLFCSISDHLMNFILVELEKNTSKDRPYVRLFTKRNIDFFLENAPNDTPLLTTNPDNNQSDQNVQSVFPEFLDNYKNMLDKYFPLVKISRKKFKDKPWITSGIKTSIKRREMLHEKFIEMPTKENELTWKRYKYEVTNCIRASETQYYRNLMCQHKNNCHNLWKIFGKILKKDKSKQNINRINSENETLTNPSQITQAFNKFFTNIGHNLAQTISNNESNDFRDYMGNPIAQSFNLCETSSHEIKYHMEKINPKKATGRDGLPGKFLNISAPIAAEPLAKLFNMSISTGEYPDILKIARVLPIHKKGESTDMNNYRPISILTHLNKIYETIICNQMKSFLNKHNILYTYQYGFREKHSTDHALIEIVDGIKLAIDDSKQAGGIFVDLKKAFDTVNHKILLTKLEQFGFRGIPNKLLKSYLTNRYQYVQIKDSKSDLRPINCGVPQGSVLGPLLFILYINDLANCCIVGKIRIFADDTAVYFACSNIMEFIQIASTIMKQLDKWFASNLLTLNTDKSYFCIFRTVQNRRLILPDTIEFNNKSIKRAKSIKYLGITLDEFLDWNEHMANVRKSLNPLFSVFYNIKRYLTIEHIRVIYYTMIYSRIKYGICAYGFANKDKLDKVQILQNKLLKVILEKSWRFPTDELHTEVNILKVKDIFYQEISSFVNKYLRGALPEVFNDYFQFFSHTYGTRGNLNRLIYPSVRTELGKKTVRYKGCEVWNNLENEQKNIKNPKRFRKVIKDSIIEIYRNIDLPPTSFN